MKAMTTILLLLFGCATFSYAQIDAIESLFEKESPEFQVTIIPSDEEGIIELEVYYTHSRVNALEASFWMTDRGDNRLNTGKKSLIGEIQTIYNRQPVTIRVDQLVDGHFYGFGLDFRRPTALINKTFTPKLIREGYQYQSPKQTSPLAQRLDSQPAAATATTDNKEFVNKSIPKNTAEAACQNPKIRLSLDRTGYCPDGKTPALKIQNAVEQDWEFAVEHRGTFGQWQALFGKGKRLAAKGAVTRTEPLCLLADGKHELRVLAWGKGCATPVVKVLREGVLIGNQQAAVTQKEEAVPQQYNFLAKSPKVAPDTCYVRGDATLVGNKLSGYVQLDSNSPCGEWNPYAVVRYVYPGYRDIALEPFNLPRGERIEFEIELNAQDLSRTIHPINVLTYIQDGSRKEQLVNAFWIRSENQNKNLSQQTPPPPPPAQNKSTTTDEPQTTPTDSNTYTNAGTTTSQQATTERQENISNTDTDIENTTYSSNTTRTPDTNLDNNSTNTYEDDYAFTDQADPISVKATDPNCTQINELQLVYDLQRSKQPLYISWLSPRCCQESGCEYTIWAGDKPNQLSLMMKGYKSGAKINELINPSAANANYYEVVVKTANGNRKAAYVIGEGPKYGFEEILAYHDRFNAPQSDAIKFQKTTVADDEQATNNELSSTKSPNAKATNAAFKWDNNDDLLTPSTAFDYHRPNLPISKFSPCKYKNDIRVVGDTPIHVGDELTIAYNYDREGYRYTLYQRPEGSEDWVVAPNTRELQQKAKFNLKAGKYHAGDYIVLLYKVDKGWGCLSEPLVESLKLEVLD
ncbi:MAG: hypothetical protein AAGI49_00400 [Bacteroidota bacterium]